jgi:predicted metal-dependent hydrolase
MQQIKGTKDNYQLAIDELTQPVQVKKTARARRMTLRVSHTQREIVLTTPRQTGWRQAGAFVVKHLDWLQQQLQVLPDPVPFDEGAVVPLEGDPHLIRFLGAGAVRGGKRPSITLAPPDMTSELPLLCVAGGPEHAPRRLTDWLKKQARTRLCTQAAIHAERLDLSYSRISVRDQSSRWGSCSSTGTLSFSWRLIFAPEPVLDYVAAHEVAHLKEMNHSPRFWKLVAKTFPDYADARAWLRQHGQELHRYGASR